MKEALIVPGFQIERGMHDKQLLKKILGSRFDDYITLRGYQERAWGFRHHKHIRLEMPMGSGKSITCAAIASSKMLADRALKCIIAVPQTIIAAGFKNRKISLPDGTKIDDWSIQRDLTNPQTKNATDSIIKFLTSSHKTDFLGDRILITTHASLVKAYKKLREESSICLLDNIILCVDESHHVCISDRQGFENQEELSIKNQIGNLVSSLLSSDNLNTHVMLITATFFRGDRISILMESQEAKFAKCSVAYDEYLSELEHLESFSFNFVPVEGSYTNTISKVIDQTGPGKEIVYIPTRNTILATDDKYLEANEIVSMFRGKGVPSNKIINLVDEANRDAKKQELERIREQNPAEVDAIVTLNMFKEGADWECASRVFCVGYRGSLTELVQTFGRLLRDYEGKKHVEFNYLLPFSLDQLDEEEYTSRLNDYFKSILACLLMENIFNPVTLRFSSTEKGTEKSDGDVLDGTTDEPKEREEKTNWLNVVLPDPQKQHSLVEDALLLLMKLDARGDIHNVDDLFSSFSEEIKPILGEYGINDFTEAVTQYLWAIPARASFPRTESDASSIPFDILKKVYPLGFLPRFTSGICTGDTLKAFREALIKSKVFLPFEKAREEVRAKGFKNVAEYLKWFRENQPANFPIHPCRTYAGKGWKNWPDFLGNDNTPLNPKGRKKQLYEMAISGAKRPNKHSENEEERNLAQSLINYTRKGSKSYDEKFLELIKNNSTWFDEAEYLSFDKDIDLWVDYVRGLDGVDSLVTWGEKDGASYKQACELGIQRKIADKLDWSTVGGGIWLTFDTDEQWVEYLAVLGFTRIKEWTVHPSYQHALKKLNRVREIARKAGWTIKADEFWRKLGKNDVTEWVDLAVNEFGATSLNDWCEKDRRSHDCASRLGVLRDIAEAAGWKVKGTAPWNFFGKDVGLWCEHIHTLEGVMSRSRWCEKHQASYAIAKKEKILDEISNVMGWKDRKAGEWLKFGEDLGEWQEFLVKIGATYREDWLKKHSASYWHADTKKGLKQRIAEKMGWDRLKNQYGK